jgi:hypothetical protein
MSRVSISDKFIAEGTEKAVRKRILKFLEESEMDVVEDRDGEIEVYQGSQMRTRLLGGWFVNAKYLPKKAWIKYSETEEGIRVKATIEESLGFGLMDPALEARYETFFNDWLNDLRDAVR